ncbi:zinc finger protein 568-like [Colletes gigas]|uniref:zinc finger protein 568-like n=1 Tax=Colletes gigas TaxID=935657 RepID=UPI001C9B576E|nr:zinc finger protein 568-like [Colletes gigas]
MLGTVAKQDEPRFDPPNLRNLPSTSNPGRRIIFYRLTLCITPRATMLLPCVHHPVMRPSLYAQGPRCAYDLVRKEQNRSYPCHKCGNAFTRKNNLYNHLKFQCGQMPRFNCPYCSYRTRHSSNVRSHVRRMHPGQRVYVLDVRGKQDSQHQWIS